MVQAVVMPLGVRIIHWSWGNGEITAVGVTIVPMTDSRVSIAPWSAHDTVSIAVADGSAVGDWSNVELIQRCNECNLEDKTRLCRPIAGSRPELGTSPDWERPKLIIPAVNSEPSMHVYPNGNAVATVSSHRSISQWKFLWIQAISNHFYVSLCVLAKSLNLKLKFYKPFSYSSRYFAPPRFWKGILFSYFYEKLPGHN
jgi:hypothetical protein